MLKTTRAPLTLRQRARFSKKQLPLLNSPVLQNELTDLFQLIQTKITQSPLIDELEKAFHFTEKIIRVAPRFDYSSSVRANGFWTFGQIIVRFFRLILYSIKKNSFNSEICFRATQVLNISLRMIDMVIDQENLDVNNNDLDQDNKFVKPCLFNSTRIQFDEVFKTQTESKQEFIDFFANFNGFWFSQCTMILINRVSGSMGYIYCQSKQFRLTRNIFSRRQRAKMFIQMTLGSTAKELSRSWNITESPIGYKLMNRFERDLKSVEIRKVALPAQKRWRISVDEHQTVYDAASMTQEELLTKRMATQTSDGVPCWILQSKKLEKINEENRTVLLHVHGGGFVSQSPQSHKGYLQDWIDKFPEMTIVSVDYRLAPKFPFPAAPQDVLDVYLWLLQSTSASLLGFVPTKIALAGDSAGANIIVSLCIALNSIQNSLTIDDEFSKQLILPQAVYSFYGVYMITPRSSPSRAISFNDGILNIGPILSCLNAYIPVNVDVIEEYEKFASNPFVSPLMATNFEFSNNIALHLFVSNYDPFLDDSVELAKHWTGPVRLTILPDLPHGFLSFISRSKKCRQACDKCAEHFAEFQN